MKVGRDEKMGEMRGWGMMIRRKKCSRENVRMTYLKVINSSGKKTILKCMAIFFFKLVYMDVSLPF